MPATAEDCLQKAMAAKTPGSRARYAKMGLSSARASDDTIRAMLLRQLYLAHFEQRRFADARRVVTEALALDVLPDVLHQDAARVCLADGDLDAAVGHLRFAARRGPASRRAFHLWTLGSTLFLAQRYDDAVIALTRAARWATRDRPLYLAHLALVRIAKGEPVKNLGETIAQLAESPAGQGYGRFVLGHLAYAAGEYAVARRYLQAFVKRTEAGRVALGIALAGELEMSRATLSKMSAN